MRRLAAVVAVLALTACSKETPKADTAAAAPPPAPAALTDSAIGGTWEAVGMPMDKDTVVVRFTMNNTDTGSGTTITFPSGVTVPSVTRQISGDSVVSTSGGFKSQVRAGKQVSSTQMVLRMQDGKLAGVLHAKYSNGDTTSYRIMATKKP